MCAAMNKLKTWLPALWIASEGTLRMKYKEPRFVCQPCCVRLDSVVYNPGAIYWDTVENTPVKRLDLMYEVNLRGAFALSRCVLPTLRAQVRALSWCHAVARHVASVAMPVCTQNAGTVTFVAPPIYSRFIRGKTAYATTKMGLTILALGLAHELKGTNVVVRHTLRCSDLMPTHGPLVA